jgi:hypothetical protein
MKSPAYTFLDLLSPSNFIFSAVLIMYFEPGSTSPILIQFIPFTSLVIPVGGINLVHT